MSFVFEKGNKFVLMEMLPTSSTRGHE